MSPATTERDLSQYTGKRVIVTRNLPEPNEKGESAVEIEGQIEVANDLGLLIKPKGKVQLDLIPKAEVEEVRLAESASKPLKRTTLKVVKPGQARRHLVERHGVTLDWANNVTEEQAFDYHLGLDHEALDLGHVHSDKAAPDADAEATADGEAA
jgi:hypothetical protein